MGVHGLWQLLNSTGQPVPLETLEGKVLAVDVSVWLHQLSKGMRDGQGNPIPHAHLHGLFTRICKLLYYRIKPVFVFDGGVPALKKETLAARRGKRDDAEKESERMQQKILSNLIRSEVVKQSLGLDSVPKAIGTSKPAGKKDALFHLPPMPEKSPYPGPENEADDAFEERRELQRLVEHAYGDITKIDVQSEDFLSLPVDIQHEIIYDIKLRRKNYNMSRIADMPDDSKDFSNFQMEKLLKQSKLSTRLGEVRKELNTGVATDWRKQYGHSFQGGNIETQRVVSDDASHFILVKGVRRNSHEQSENNEKQFKSISKSKDVGVSDDSGSNTDELLHENQEERENANFSQSDQQIAIGKVVIGPTRSGGTGTTSQQPIHDSNLIGRSDLNGENKHASDGQNENGEVYRPVIEFETDSDSNDESSNGSEIESSNGSEIEMETKNIPTIVGESQKFDVDNTCIVIDSDDNSDLDDNMKDIQANRDLQIAIEESLKDQQAANITTGVNSNTNANPGDKELKCRSKVITTEIPEDTKKTTANEMTSEKDKNSFKNSKSSIDNKNNSYNSATTGANPSPSKSVKDISDLRKESSIFKRSISLVSSQEDTFFPKKRRQDEAVDELNDEDSNDYHDMDQNLEVLEMEAKLDNGDSKEVIVNGDESPEVMEIDSAEDESSDDDFIEVEVDTKNTKPDDMFPASIFETNITVSPSNHSDSSSVHGDQTEHPDIIDLEDGDRHGDDIEEEEKEASKAPDITLSQTSTEAESPSLPDIVSGIQSPENRVPDLVRDFQFLNENNIKGMRAYLSDETRQLRQEKGRQERLAMSITDQMHADSQALLQLFGIPYIVSPTEAEAQCAQLELVGLTNGTITDDSDIWLFGGKCVYKNFFNMAKHVECYRDTKITSSIGLTRGSLINLALLCGSDYTAGIQGVGPVTAMEILAEFHGDGITGLVKLKSWWEDAQQQLQIPTESKLRSKLRDLDISPGFPNPRVAEAYLEPTIDDSTEPFSWSLPDANQLRQFNGEKLGWSHEKTDEHLLPVLKQMKNKEHQRRISSFFQPEVHIQPAKLKSKRLQKVVTKFLNPDSVDQSETVDSGHLEGDKCDVNSKVKGQGKGCGRSRTKQKNVTFSDNLSNEIVMDMENMNEKDDTACSRSSESSKGQGHEDDKKSKYFQGNEKSNNPARGNVSSDSSGEGSFSEDSSPDSSDSSGEEMQVVEAGINVAEILNLKMGDAVLDGNDQSNTNRDRDGSSPTDQQVEDIVTEVHLDNEVEIQNEIENFETEGGFVRDSDFDSDFEFELEYESKTAKVNDDVGVTIPDTTDHVNASRLGCNKTVELGTIAKKFLAHIHNSPESKIKNVTTSAIQIPNPSTAIVEHDTSKHLRRLKFGTSTDVVVTGVIPSERQSQALCDLNENSVRTNKRNKNKNKASRDKISNSSINKTVNVTCEKQNDKVKNAVEISIDNSSNTLSNEPIRTSNTETCTNVPIKTNVIETARDNDSKSSNEPTRTSVTKTQTHDPIKTIVSGVPWTSKTKKKSVGVKRKGKPKGRNLEPVEKIEKKTTKKVSIRNPIGVVNLSESSDSD